MLLKNWAKHRIFSHFLGWLMALNRPWQLNCRNRHSTRCPERHWHMPWQMFWQMGQQTPWQMPDRHPTDTPKDSLTTRCPDRQTNRQLASMQTCNTAVSIGTWPLVCFLWRLTKHVLYIQHIVPVWSSLPKKTYNRACAYGSICGLRLQWQRNLIIEMSCFTWQWWRIALNCIALLDLFLPTSPTGIRVLLDLLHFFYIDHRIVSLVWLVCVGISILSPNIYLN